MKISQYMIAKANTSISCRWWTHTPCCIMTNVLQTKADAQCDGTKLTTLAMVDVFKL